MAISGATDILSRLPLERRVYDHYGGRENGSDGGWDAYRSQPTKSVKVSGNRKRVITSSANARPCNDPHGKRHGAVDAGRTRTRYASPILGHSYERKTYLRVDRKYASEETLKYYNIPYEEDKRDHKYLIIHQELDRRELDMIFEHTRHLRESRRRRRSSSPASRRARPRSRSESNPVDRRSRFPVQSTPGEYIEVIEVEDDEMARRAEVEVTKGLEELALHERNIAEEGERMREEDYADASEDDDSSDDDFSLDASILPSLATSSGTELDALSKEPLYSSSPSARFPIKSGPIQEMDILATNWLGSTFDESNFGALLYRKPAPPARNSKPFMRWTHLERAAPSFEEFVHTAQKVLNLPATERRHLEELLTRIQRDNEQQRQHGRDMKAFCEADVDLEGDGIYEKQTGSICCLSIPFFALEKQASGQIRSLRPGSPDHPSRPLLQSHTRMLNDKREMAQAITTMQTTPQGHCLHIQQLWCLILNTDTIITCSKLPISTLGKTLVFKDDFEGIAEHGIHLRAGNTRRWRVPARIASSLPTLISTIAERLSDLVGRQALFSLTYKSKPVRFTEWRGLMAKASRSEVECVLSETERNRSWQSKSQALGALRSVFVMAAPETGEIQKATGTAIDDSGMTKNSSQSDPLLANSMHNSGQPATLGIFRHSSNGSGKALVNLADGLHQALLSAKHVKDHYRSCGEATQHDIQLWLQDYHSSSSQQRRHQLTKRDRQLVQQKEALALLAEHYFGFFWDLDFEHVLTRKFWGALKTVVERDTFLDQGSVLPTQGDTARERDVEAATSFVRDLHSHLFSLTETFNITFGEDKDDLHALPEQFYKAWLFIHSAFAMVASTKITNLTERTSREASQQLWRAQQELTEGEHVLTVRLRKEDIEELEICTTRGIIALILDSVVRDFMNERPDVPQTYGDYCRQLEAKMVTDPLIRAHQETLRSFQQELEAIISVLRQQLEVVTYFESSISDLDTGKTLPYLTMLGTSRQDLVLGQCKANISSRLDQFSALQSRATELAEWHLAEIDTNKDRQEAAILVFTIVTIIFTPLSFVSSVFGMNSADVRDMTQGQWAYWAAAVPLTILVVVGSLWFAGAFDSLREWVSRRPSGFGGYSKIQEMGVMRTTGNAESYSRQTKPALYPGVRTRTSFPVKRSHLA